MTAEEIFDKVMSEYDTSRTYTVDWVTEAMKEYAKERCRDQRELCQQHFLNTCAYEDIKSAPEPEMP